MSLASPPSDDGELEELLRRHTVQLLTHAAGFCRSTREAEILLLATFARARRLGGPGDETCARRWLLRLMVDIYREGERRRRMILLPPPL